MKSQTVSANFPSKYATSRPGVHQTEFGQSIGFEFLKILNIFLQKIKPFLQTLFQNPQSLGLLNVHIKSSSAGQRAIRIGLPYWLNLSTSFGAAVCFSNRFIIATLSTIPSTAIVIIIKQFNNGLGMCRSLGFDKLLCY